VVRDGEIVGYVTLALDHAHLMAFTDTLRPTAERHAPIADPASGNYAFIWDDLGRNISTPRLLHPRLRPRNRRARHALARHRALRPMAR
jgi:hypothetical protein